MCLCMHVHVCMCVPVCACARLHVCMQVCARMSVHVCVRVGACGCVEGVHVCACVCASNRDGAPAVLSHHLHKITWRIWRSGEREFSPFSKYFASPIGNCSTPGKGKGSRCPAERRPYLPSSPDLQGTPALGTSGSAGQTHELDRSSRLSSPQCRQARGTGGLGQWQTTVP